MLRLVSCCDQVVNLERDLVKLRAALEVSTGEKRRAIEEVCGSIGIDNPGWNHPDELVMLPFFPAVTLEAPSRER